MSERDGPRDRDDGLDDLRAELARFVLREAGQAVATDPSLPLSAAFTQAIREEAERAMQQARSGQPTPEDLAAGVVQAIRPELVQIVRAAARGDVGKLERAGLRGVIASMPAPLLAAMAVAGLLVAFALGFAAAWMLAPRPGPVETPTMIQPAQPDAAADAALGATGDGVAAEAASVAPSGPLNQETPP